MKLQKRVGAFVTLRQALASLMMVAIVAAASPQPLVAANVAEQSRAAKGGIVKAPAPATVRKGPRNVALVSPTLSFSSKPTDLEISSARVFLEPLVAMPGAAISGENTAIAATLLSFKDRGNRDDLSSLQRFVSSVPNSRWRPAIELNMGLICLETGRFTEGLSLLERAWQAAKRYRGRAEMAVANRAVARLCLLNARLGRVEELHRLFPEVDKRALFGSDEQMVRVAHEALTQMETLPGCGFRCGPEALSTILIQQKKMTPVRGAAIEKMQSTKKGTNLSQVKAWGEQVGVNLQPARRSAGAAVPINSIVHWRLGHFSAVVAKRDDHYIVKDQTFDTESTFAVSQSTLDSESDGYFLIPAGTLPAGWKAVSAQEAATIWGKGGAPSPDFGQTLPGMQTCDGHCPTCGMAQANFWKMQATLNIIDTPLSYTCPIGPDTRFVINFNHMEPNQPATFAFTNFGQNWTLNWLSYLTVDGGTSVATLRMPGGGTEVYTPSGGSYPPDRISQATLVDMGGGTFERRMPDGAIQVYNQADGAGRIFMTQVKDQQGNTASVQYDSNFRITSIVDALSQSTTLAYVSNTVGNSGFYKVASITDPFSRAATFAYSADNANLLSITDTIGLTSQFVYDTSSSFITAMTTPYGATSFYQYVPGILGTYPARGLRITHPDGTSTVVENWVQHSCTTFFWNRHQTSLYPSDPVNKIYTHCEVTKWTRRSAGGLEEFAPRSMKQPLESEVFYTYPDQTLGPDFTGSSNKPIEIKDKFLGNATVNAVVGGTATTNDWVQITVHDPMGTIGNRTFQYTVQAGDSLTKIATELAALMNADSQLPKIGMVVSSSGPVVSMSSNSNVSPGDFSIHTRYIADTSGGATTLTLRSQTRQLESVALTGTVSAGSNQGVRFQYYSPSGSNTDVTYVQQAGDTLANVASGLASAINGNTFLQGYNTVATATGAVINIETSIPGNVTFSTIGGGNVIFTFAPATNGSTQNYFYQYNSLGHVTQSIDPAGRKFNYQYAANNVDLEQITETRGINNFLIGKWTYNSQHRPLTYTDGSGQVTNYGYNPAGQLTSIQDALSNTTTLTYTGSYLTQINGPLPGNNDITTLSYDGFGRLFTQTDSEGYVLTFFYDQADRPTRTLFMDGTSEETIYDKLDAVLMKDRNGRWTQKSFDSLDQLTFEIDPLGRKTQYQWCVCGSLESLTDPAGHTTHWHHDLQGRLTDKTYADNTSINYVYETWTSRLRSRTDALAQSTLYLHNIDNTPFQVSHKNAVNPTATVTYLFDQNYNRITSIQKNDWGTISYSYNPYIMPGGTPTTGGGMLALVHNDVIANSDISYQYDQLGRTTNRSINGASNSITWSYDPMSRITAELNALGNFGYTYVDDTPGSSKGTLRLASLNYPNGQVTNFDWFDNIGDQRLKEIHNQSPTATTLSKFTYGYNPAGEITKWTQRQRGETNHYKLEYDLAGQLISAQSGLGNAPPPYTNQYLYEYDAASNRTSVQQSIVDTARISGTVTPGDILRIIVHNDDLAGGKRTIPYTVVAGDTLASIATNLAAAVTADSQLQAIGVNAASASAPSAPATIGALITLKSAAPKPTHFTQSKSAGSTETIDMSNVVNGTENARIGGTVTAGDVLTITVKESSLPGGQQAVSYTVQAGDSLNTIAANLGAAVNANVNLQAIGVAASVAQRTVSIRSLSPRVTTYTRTLSAGATETIALSINQNGMQTALLGGTATAGNVLSMTIFDTQLAGDMQTANYTVVGMDTPATMAAGLAAAINANTNLANNGISATSVSNVLNMKSNSIRLTTYRQSTSTGATATIALAPSFHVSQSRYNNVNELIKLEGGGAARFQATTNKAVKSASIGTQVLPIKSSLPVATTSYAASSSRTPAATLTAQYVPGGFTGGDYFQITVGGSARAGDVINLSIFDVRLLAGSETVSYTVQTGDTTSTIAAALANAIVSNPRLGAVGISNNLISGNVFSVIVFIASQAQPHPISLVDTSTSPGTETVTQAFAGDENTNITIGGTVTTGDTVSLAVENSQLPTGLETVSYTAQAGDTTTSIATGLKNAINANSNLQTLGIGATSSGSVVTVATFTYFTASTSPAATETIAFAGANRGSVHATIGGTITAGDVLTITANNAKLPGGQQSVSRTVVAGDTLLTVAQALASAINANANLQSIGVTVDNNATLEWSESLVGNGLLPPADSRASVSAVDGDNNSKTNNFSLGVNGGGSSTLAFDANGNMTSDGTNSYAWDADNRLIRITYPGTNNFSDFSFDGLSRNVRIVETTSGSIASTKQFIWSGSTREEVRDGSASIIAQLFKRGEKLSSTIYLISTDHLGSTREMTNNSGGIESQYLYGPFGQVVILQGQNIANSQYASYYAHERSTLSLCVYRQYNSQFARWQSRDPLQEAAGNNLYAYVLNYPSNFFDPLGFAERLSTDFETTVEQSASSRFERGSGWMGCRSVVAIAMDLPPTAYPENDHPGQKNYCYLAKDDDPSGQGAYNKASCHPCPNSNQDFVVWCKQGTLNGTPPTTNSDGTLSNASGIWQPTGDFNYFVHTGLPTAAFMGGSSRSCGPLRYPSFPENNFPSMMCCKTCK